MKRCLDCIPDTLPVVVVDDLSDVPFSSYRANVTVLRLDKKGYFAGAVNAGISATRTDVLILNQDVTLTGTAWLDLLAEKRSHYAMIGERITGDHPSFPHGYIHGTFLFLRRDAIESVGLLNGVGLPLVGGNAASGSGGRHARAMRFCLWRQSPALSICGDGKPTGVVSAPC